MFTTSVVALGMAALAVAAPTNPAPKFSHVDAKNATILAISDTYTLYTGNGSPDQGWPTQDAWGTYDELWGAFSAVMPQTCGWNSVEGENSAQEIADINTAIQQVSGESGVDSRFILAIVMQESKGCVRVGNTANGVNNPGLMQSHNGSGNCIGVNPCPFESILQMIRDGTTGTADGDGLQQTIAKAAADTGDAGVRSFYAGARVYNSGSAVYDDLNNGITSTACYATDVANRLQGWILADTACFLA